MKIKKNASYIFLFLCFLVLMLSSCHKDQSPEILAIKNGSLSLNMSHKVDGEIIQFDSLLYASSLGFRYMVNDLQYFISGISLHRIGGSWAEVPDSTGIHYLDAKILSSCNWFVSQQIKEGTYDSIGFIFGLNEITNLSGRFPDPPERDMFWPEILGGGYHYLKMNMKWKKEGMPQTMPFMFHIGIGQMYSGNTANPDSIIGFIQNYFYVKLPVAVQININRPAFVEIAMHVDAWFDGQNAFDFSLYSMGIMQNQLGMYRACMNGKRAFSVQMVSSN